MTDQMNQHHHPAPALQERQNPSPTPEIFRAGVCRTALRRFRQVRLRFPRARGASLGEGAGSN